MDTLPTNAGHYGATSIDVIVRALEWFDAGRRVVLVTVTKTWGSAPRPVGSTLALCDDGRIVGSVSGGCIEDDLIEDFFRNAIDPDSPSIREYGVDADQAYRFGLPCGGTIQLVLEPITPSSALSELLKRIAVHGLVARAINVETGHVQMTAVRTDSPVKFHEGILTVCFGRSHRMLLIGAGQMSSFIAANALALDYEVTVCDPREEYMASWQVPGVNLSSEMPDDIVLRMGLDARSAVVTLTHDPKLDDLALMEALKTPAFYVGAIGSRRSQAARQERLKLFDVSDAELENLRGPAGLYIAARTPAEIGLSILAEITAYRNGAPVERAFSVNAGKERYEMV